MALHDTLVKLQPYLIHLLVTDIVMLIISLDLTVYKRRLDLITNALCSFAQTSSSTAVASISNENLNEALILGGMATLFQTENISKHDVSF